MHCTGCCGPRRSGPPRLQWGLTAASVRPWQDSVVQLRHDQLSALTLNGTGIAVAVDLGDDGRVPWTPPTARHGGIHPRNKTEVGRRLALSFGAVATGASMVAEGPRPLRATVESGQVHVAFDPATSEALGLTPSQQCHGHGKLANSTPCCNSGLAGMPFEVRLRNGTYAVVPAEVAGTVVSITLPPGADVTAVRYCAQGFPLCVLTNAQGLPSTPFVLNVSSAVE